MNNLLKKLLISLGGAGLGAGLGYLGTDAIDDKISEYFLNKEALDKINDDEILKKANETYNQFLTKEQQEHKNLYHQFSQALDDYYNKIRSLNPEDFDYITNDMDKIIDDISKNFKIPRNLIIDYLNGKTDLNSLYSQTNINNSFDDNYFTQKLQKLKDNFEKNKEEINKIFEMQNFKKVIYDLEARGYNKEKIIDILQGNLDPKDFSDYNDYKKAYDLHEKFSNSNTFNFFNKFLSKFSDEKANEILNKIENESIQNHLKQYLQSGLLKSDIANEINQLDKEQQMLDQKLNEFRKNKKDLDFDSLVEKYKNEEINKIKEELKQNSFDNKVEKNSKILGTIVGGALGGIAANTIYKGLSDKLKNNYNFNTQEKHDNQSINLNNSNTNQKINNF